MGRIVLTKLAVKNKEQFIIAECKAKSKRKYYDDTGIKILSTTANIKK